MQRKKYSLKIDQLTKIFRNAFIQNNISRDNNYNWNLFQSNW